MEASNYTDIFFKEYIFSDLYFLNIGHETCEPNHSFGPFLKENYQIHYIVKGKGSYQVRNVTYHLEKGDFFITRPNEMVYYEADSENPWEYYWFGFSGDKTEDVLKLNHIHKNSHIGQTKDNTLIESKFKELIQFDFFNDQLKLKIQAAFFDLLAHFTVKSDDPLVIKQNNTKDKYTESFLLYIHNNYYRHSLTIEEIAHSLFLHPSYFSQIIKESLGMTAQDYLLTYRLTNAKRLLESTTLSIENISFSVGYINRHSFSRAFKKKFSQAPSEYRYGFST